MTNLHKAALIAAASFALSGCATVMNGTSQNLDFNSDPGGATVKVTSGATCVTPCKLELKRGNDLRADFNKEGYRPTYVLVKSKLGGATFGNILAGGIVGAVVDSSNGSSKHLDPNPVHVRLVADGQAGQEVLIDKKGKDAATVQSHNDLIRSDVARTIGADAAGMSQMPPAAQAPAAAAVEPVPAVEPAPAPAPEPAPAATEG